MWVMTQTCQGLKANDVGQGLWLGILTGSGNIGLLFIITWSLATVVRHMAQSSRGQWQQWSPARVGVVTRSS